MQKFYFHIAVFFLALANISGQNRFESRWIELESLGIDDGLAVGRITSIIQDEVGFLWMGSSKGLHRYDGNSVKVFFKNINDSLSLPDENIYSLFIDSRNWIWIATETEGLVLFDPKTETFHTLGLDVAMYAQIHEDAFKRIWYFDGELRAKAITVTIPKFPTRKEIKSSANFLISDYTKSDFSIQSFQFFHNRNTWLATNEEIRVYRMSDSPGPSSVNMTLDFSMPYSPKEAVLHLDKVGNAVYFVDKMKRLIKLDATNGNLHGNMLLNHPNIKGIPNVRFVDQKGRIWVGDKNNHLFLVEFDEKRIIEIKTNFERVNLNSGSWYIDRNENIWIRTSGYGVYKFPTKTERFAYFGNQHYGPSIYGIYQLSENKIYTEKGNLCIDLNDRKQFSLFSALQLNGLCPNSGVWKTEPYNDSFIVARCYEIDKKHLFDMHLKPVSTKLDHNPIVFPHDLGIQEEPIRSFESAEKKIKISITTYAPKKDKGKAILVIRTDLNGENPEYFSQSISDETQFKLGEDNVHLYTSNGDLLVGYARGGLLKWDDSEKTIEHFIHRINDPKSLSSNNVLSLLEDPDDTDRISWVGTGKGLHKFDRRDRTFKSFTQADGLPDNTIYGIQPDGHSNLWLSTNRGMSLFDPKRLEFRNFTRKDGLQHNEFNTNAHLRLKDGRLVFGGVGGLTWFNPDDFYQNRQSAEVVITGIKVDHSEIVFQRPNEGMRAPVIPQPIEYSTQITLKPKQRIISFECAVLDLTHVASNEFKYKLEGYDEDWLSIGTDNTMTFTNLAPGKYKLRVQGRNSDHLWAEMKNPFLLVVLPPWWQTWWFRSLALLALVYSLYSLYAFRLAQQAKIHSIRNKISRDLHDDIGSTLSSISLFGTVAQERLKEKDPETSSILEKINEDSISVMESINDIVWAINSDNDTMHKLVNRMRAYTSDLDSNTPWNIEYDIDDRSLHQILDMVSRRNIYLVFKEAVNNAIKYSEGTRIQISIKKIKDNFELIIKDDGLGIDKTASENRWKLGGNGLSNMKNRAKEIGGSLTVTSISNGGTKVCLSWKS